MRNVVFIILISVISHLASYQKAFSQNDTIQLSEAEHSYVKKHSVIRVSNDPSYRPFDFTENAKPAGYSIDLLNIIGKRTGLKFDFVSGFTWLELQTKFSNGELDLMHSISQTQNRKKTGLFSTPYKTFNDHFIIRNNSPEITSIKQLVGKTVAVGSGWADQEYLAKHFPDIHLLPVSSLEDMVLAVSQGKADALIHDETLVRYTIKRTDVKNLVISGKFEGFNQGQKRQLHFMAQKYDPELISIMNKALESLAPGEFTELDRKWFGSQTKGTNRAIEWTNEERRYLFNKARLKVCIDPKWMPFEEVNENGKHVGISADYYHLFEKRIGIPIDLFATRTWKETIASVKNRRCDLISLAKPTDKRRKFLDFTTPFLTFPTAIVTHKEDDYIGTIADNLDKTLAIVQGYSNIRSLKNEYPTIKIIEVKNRLEGLKKVQNKEVFSFLENELIAAYVLQTENLTDLKIAYKLPAVSGLSIATRNDEPLLGQIFEKAIQSLSEADYQRINNKWIAVQVEEVTDYTLVYQIIAFVFLIGSIFGFFFYKLRSANFKLNIAKKEAEELVLELVATKTQLEQKNLMLAKADKSKTIFLAAASHDLRQPLHAISLFMEALSNSIKGDQKEGTTNSLSLLDRLKKSVSGLQGLINSLLDISKLDAGTIELNIETFPIQEILADIFEQTTIIADEKGVIVRSVDSSSTVVCDKILLLQILENLTSNAVKYTENGKILIGCRHENNALRIEVWDTGEGIPVENLDNIFDEFLQLNNPERKREKGLGLGLSIVSKAAKLLDTEIKVRSIVGKGSVFSVVIPTTDYDPQDDSLDPKKTNVTFVEGKTSFLVVEDDKDILEATILLLKGWGYNAIGALDGEQALKLIQEGGKPDFLILDYNLPNNRNGIEIYKEIVKFFDKTIPSMIITGTNDITVHNEIKNNGLLRLSKPVDARELRGTVAGLLKFSESEELV